MNIHDCFEVDKSSSMHVLDMTENHQGEKYSIGEFTMALLAMSNEMSTIK
jgi:hypothetical protein